MNLTPDTNILIVGLGVMGGSYARALSKKGYYVNCITKDPEDIVYAMERGMIKQGSTEPDPNLIAAADLIIFALYPHVFIEWVRSYQSLFHPGTVITDVTGVKGGVVTTVQSFLRSDVEFIAAVRTLSLLPPIAIRPRLFRFAARLAASWDSHALPS